MHTIFTMQLGHYEIAYRQSRIAPGRKNIILVHGIGVSSAYFIPLLDALSPQYNVYALDLPGYGKAKKPEQPLTIDELAKVCHEFIVQHDLSPTVVIGHSMGCQIIASLACTSPADIEKFICIAPTVNRRERSRPIQLLRLMQDSLHESLRTNLTIYADYMRMGPLRYLVTSAYMIQDKIEECLLRSAAPALIIRGENDPIVPRKWVQYLKTVRENITVDEIPAAPHAVHYQKAHEVARLCEAFIND